MLVTDDGDPYRRSFAMHDQGHSPNRKGVEVGARPMLGLNFRMTELNGAVLLAQLRKLDRIRAHLRDNRDTVWSMLERLPGIGFRELPDRDGDLATHFVVIFPDAETAAAVTGALDSITLDHSGWHVYSHMENLLDQRTMTGSGCPFDCSCTHDGSARYEVGMLPGTDALLARSMSFAVGVIDPNLAPFGLRMRDSAETARRQTERFIHAYRAVVS